jgi:hypothetical protein
MRRRQWWGVLGLGCLLSILIGGCQLENVGSLKRSPEVTAAFEVFRVPADYSYYFLNQESSPFGVVGLKKGYWLEGPDWHRVSPSSKMFQKVVGLVAGFPAQGGRSEGFHILDSKGDLIGIWYSSLGAGVTMDPGTQRVMLTTGSPWLQH